jgi:hypothetical protein
MGHGTDAETSGGAGADAGARPAAGGDGGALRARRRGATRSAFGSDTGAVFKPRFLQNFEYNSTKQ